MVKLVTDGTFASGQAAVAAWRSMRPRVRPSRVTKLVHHDKTTVYRLHGAGPAGSAVIAKRGRKSTLAVERRIYERILPRLPVTALQCYGFVEEKGPRNGERPCWLFLEDAGGRWYSDNVKEHRQMAARWLGLMHTSASRLAAAAKLPARGPDFYLDALQSGRETILQHFSHLALNAEDRALLKAIVAQSELVESRWNDVNQFCSRMPQTLVHGDFVDKNVRLRKGNLFLLDWETAGWGSPAPDVSSLHDLATYHEVIRQAWPKVSLQDVRLLADYGGLLRLLVAMRWDALELSDSWFEEPLANLRLYHGWMTDCIRALDWGGTQWTLLPRWATRASVA